METFLFSGKQHIEQALQITEKFLTLNHEKDPRYFEVRPHNYTDLLGKQDTKVLRSFTYPIVC